jgi:hypothetical protein
LQPLHAKRAIRSARREKRFKRRNLFSRRMGLIEPPSCGIRLVDLNTLTKCIKPLFENQAHTPQQNLAPI